MTALKEIFNTQLKFLFFRPVKIDLKNSFRVYFTYIFIATWLVGLGRYWDHPNAQVWQYAGLGSLIYIFALSLVLYLVVKPLRPEYWSFKLVLVFVGLTSLPAILYAIPVERFMSLKSAQIANAWFLAIVAIWRVALYIRFLVTVARLSNFKIIVATLLPLSAIVASLAALNLEHVVFDIMAGIREENSSPYDTAYMIVFWLTIIAYFVFPVTAIAYFGSIIHAYLKSRRSAQEVETN